MPNELGEQVGLAPASVVRALDPFTDDLPQVTQADALFGLRNVTVVRQESSQPDVERLLGNGRQSRIRRARMSAVSDFPVPGGLAGLRRSRPGVVSHGRAWNASRTKSRPIGPDPDGRRHAMAAPVLYGRLKKALQAVGSLRTVRPLVG